MKVTRCPYYSVLYSLQGILGRGATHRTCSSLPKTCLTFVYSLSRLSGKQVFPDTVLGNLDASPQTRQNLFDKPCRIIGVCENMLKQVFRT